VVTTAPVTIEQAAALLNVSASTIRRRIKAGELRVTETHRPQGIVWLVHLPAGVSPAAATATVDTAPVDTTPSTEPAMAASSMAQAEAISGLVQTTVAAVLGPLVAELAASRQTNERQAEEIARLSEDRGRLTAENEALKTAHAKQEAQPAPAPVAATDNTPTSRLASLWRLWPAVLALVAAVLLALLLVWPR
jgi:excisionase family DNA binding protein